MEGEEATAFVNKTINHLNKQLNLKVPNQFRPLPSETQGFNHFHVSLTRLFFLRSFQIEPFIRNVRQAMTVPSFYLSASQVHIFTNEDKSRSFCSLLIQRGFNKVIDLIHQLDEVLVKYKKEKFYDPPVPHCTVGSVVGDLSNTARELGIFGNETEEDDEEEIDEHALEQYVCSIVLSIGNQTHIVRLRSLDCLKHLNSL